MVSVSLGFLVEKDALEEDNVHLVAQLSGKELKTQIRRMLMLTLYTTDQSGRRYTMMRTGWKREEIIFACFLCTCNSLQLLFE